jgi:hypothetical protein
MPYIKKDDRAQLDINLSPHLNLTAGELNYSITRLINRYIKYHGKSYDTLNAVIGVLSCAQHELYRRVVVPYEKKKEKQNGDVYTV